MLLLEVTNSSIHTIAEWQTRVAHDLKQELGWH